MTPWIGLPRSSFSVPIFKTTSRFACIPNGVMHPWVGWEIDKGGRRASRRGGVGRVGKMMTWRLTRDVGFLPADCPRRGTHPTLLHLAVESFVCSCEKRLTIGRKLPRDGGGQEGEEHEEEDGSDFPNQQVVDQVDKHRGCGLIDGVSVIRLGVLT